MRRASAGLSRLVMKLYDIVSELVCGMYVKVEGRF